MGEGEDRGKLIGAGGLAAVAIPLAESVGWDALRKWLVRTGRASNADILNQGPSGNTSIDTSHLPPRETEDELKERMRDAFQREMREYMAVNYHVTYDAATGLWNLTEEGKPDPVCCSFDTQAEAAEAGRMLTAGNGQVKVHKRDGSFSEMSE